MTEYPTSSTVTCVHPSEGILWDDSVRLLYTRESPAGTISVLAPARGMDVTAIADRLRRLKQGPVVLTAPLEHIDVYVDTLAG